MPRWRYSAVVSASGIHQHYKLMKDFSYHIGDILETVTDILQPRSFEEFEKYGLSETPTVNPDGRSRDGGNP